MNLLYIAYSCSPHYGSEDQIGWNIPMASAEEHRVFVVTKQEHKEAIEQYVKEHHITNPTFYFVDIPSVFKKICRGFLYSGRLNIWHKRVFPLAKKLCDQHKIELIHQITPVEFRAIGPYGDIENVNFVCGPVGGAEYMPDGLKDYAKKHRMVEWVRKFTNQLYRNRLKHRRAHLLYANYETMQFLGVSDQEPITEIAISEQDIIQDVRCEIDENEPMVFLVAGRVFYRKGHEFLLDALLRLPESTKYQCRIVGDGPELKKLKEKCAKHPALREHVIFTGAIPYEQMNQEYARAHVLIMPSLRETTGSVSLEAMAKGLPVITINKFGASHLVGKEAGWLYGGNTKEEYLCHLASTICFCVDAPEEVLHQGQTAKLCAKENTWSQRIKIYNSIYNSLRCCR